MKRAGQPVWYTIGRGFGDMRFLKKRCLIARRLWRGGRTIRRRMKLSVADLAVDNAMVLKEIKSNEEPLLD